MTATGPTKDTMIVQRLHLEISAVGLFYFSENQQVTCCRLQPPSTQPTTAQPNSNSQALANMHLLPVEIRVTKPREFTTYVLWKAFPFRGLDTQFVEAFVHQVVVDILQHKNKIMESWVVVNNSTRGILTGHHRGDGPVLAAAACSMREMLHPKDQRLIVHHCSFQMRPVTRSLSSCLVPLEKKRAMLRWMMRPSKLSRTFLWPSRMLRGVPCHVSFRPFPPTSRL